jgi:D-alanyl-D-alanine carboxypeptidase
MKAFISHKKSIIVAALVAGSGIFQACSKADVAPTELCAYSTPSSFLDHPKADDFQHLIDLYVAKGLPGIVALVEDENGKWVGYSGKADIRNNTPFLPCMPSKVASITKMMVATVAFQLQQEGVWSLDDKLSDYIDNDILSRIENAQDVSIRNCLQHTTGIYELISDSDFYLAVLNNPNKNWEAEELLEFVYGKPAQFEANTEVAYTNTNTLLVAMAMEVATGKPHSHELKNRIWTPLQMNDTYYQSRQRLPNNVAQGYYDLYNDGTIVNVSNLITGSGNGYGGVYSTVFDLDRYLTALFIDRSLLSENSLSEMTTFLVESERREIGVGVLKPFLDWDVEPGIGHTGRDLGYSADLFYFPTVNNRKMIFVVNYGTDGDTPLREVFWEFERKMIELVQD